MCDTGKRPLGNRTYFLMRLYSHAPWPQKSQNFFHRQERHTLWRDLFAASLLKRIKLKSLFSKQFFFVCFNGITKDYWHGELRPGDAHTATGVLDFLEASFAKVPPSVKTVILCKPIAQLLLLE